MKGKFLSVLLGVALTLMVYVPTHGQGSSGNKPVGTWNVVITRPTAPPGQPLSFPALWSFVPGGVLLTSGTSFVHTPGHGVWERDSGRSYTAVLEFFRLDLQGQYLGSQRVTLEIELAADGNSFTATNAIELLDPDGTVVGTGTATSVGTRMTIAPQ
jgi:hypothetical protein